MSYFQRIFIRSSLIVVFFFTLTGSLPTMPAAQDRTSVSTETTDELTKAELIGELPLLFIKNTGQVNDDVEYLVRGSDKSLYFTPRGVTIVLTEGMGGNGATENGEGFIKSALYAKPGRSQKIERWILKLDFVGANPDVRIESEQLSQATISYFKGKPESWRTGIPTFTKLIYKNLWEGIDLVFSGTMDRLKYEFVVQPGADPRNIALAYSGAQDLRINNLGQLEVVTGLGTLTDQVPVAWQDMGESRVNVEVGYRLETESVDSLKETRLYGFKLGNYDSDKLLVIDPEVIIFAGYIGGSLVDVGKGVALDASGAIYIVGETLSDENTFPVKTGPDLTYNGMGGDLFDVFVAKVKPDGRSLEYAGYIGGSGEDVGQGIAVDSNGAVYVTGYTWSDETSFPVLVGPDLTLNNVGNAAFVAKVKPDGTGLEYAGYIGGSGDNDLGFGIAVDASGSAYVAGSTTSDENSFPVIGGPDLTFNGSGDAFVAKVRPDGSGFVYAGYIGGINDDSAAGIALDSSGAVYVIGTTDSSEASFPVIVGPDLTYTGDQSWDTFVAKVSPDGSSLEYAGYIGGSNNDYGYGIAVDSNGAAYLTGVTEADEITFPVKGGPDLTFNGTYGYDAYIAKVKPDGSELEYAGYIGGNGNDYGQAIAVDLSGAAYVVGSTDSTESSFPVIGGPDLTYNGSFNDAFIAKVNPYGSGLEYSGYIGGSSKDLGYGIAVDISGNAYVTGVTWGDETTFPVSGGPDLTFNGGNDAFVVKVSGEAYKPWLLMFYLAEDNNLSDDPISYIYTLKNINNPNINIAIFVDYIQSAPKYIGISQNEVITVNKNELNTGDPATLIDFITWAKQIYPSKYAALTIYDHGNALSGVAQDDSSGGDWLNPPELKQVFTSVGKIDVIDMYACLMANFEAEYQLRGLVDYYVASENVAWSDDFLSSYVSTISADTIPKDLAINIAISYDDAISAMNRPFTVSVADMSKIEIVAEKTSALAQEIRSLWATTSGTIWGITDSGTVQRFDDSFNFSIDNEDLLVDLYDFARVVGYLPEFETQSNELISALGDYIIYNKSQSGNFVYDGQNYTYNLDNAHGVSIGLPRLSISFYNSSWLDFAEGADWIISPFSIPNFKSNVDAGLQWGPFISDLVKEFNPDTPDTSTPPDLVGLLSIYSHKYYIPIIAR